MEAIRATKEGEGMTTVAEYYTRDEIIALLKGKQFLLDIDEEKALAPYVVVALACIPKGTIDWLLTHGCGMGLDGGLEYIGSTRWTSENLWGVCQFVDDEKELYQISLSPDLLSQTGWVFIEVILHELAHATCKHKDNGSEEQIKQHEVEADDQVNKWIHDYCERMG